MAVFSGAPNLRKMVNLSSSFWMVSTFRSVGKFDQFFKLYATTSNKSEVPTCRAKGHNKLGSTMLRHFPSSAHVSLDCFPLWLHLNCSWIVCDHVRSGVRELCDHEIEIFSQVGPISVAPFSQFFPCISWLFASTCGWIVYFKLS